MKIVKTHHNDYLEIFSSQKNQFLRSKRFCGWGSKKSQCGSYAILGKCGN